MRFSDMPRYSQGFGFFGPLEQHKKGDLFKVKEAEVYIRELQNGHDSMLDEALEMQRKLKDSYIKLARSEANRHILEKICTGSLAISFTLAIILGMR